MKRVLILTACVVLGSKLAANAYYVDDGFIRGTPIRLNATQDQVNLSLLPVAVPSGLTVTTLDVTCVTVESGASFYLGGVHNADGSGNWAAHLMSNGYQPLPTGTPPESYFNFDTKIDAIINAGTFPDVTSFTGSAFISYPSEYLSAGSLLGSVVINNGSWVRITGTLGYSDQSNQSFTSLVPEPSALILLTSGLIGVLAYVWRKWK